MRASLVHMSLMGFLIVLLFQTVSVAVHAAGPPAPTPAPLLPIKYCQVKYKWFDKWYKFDLDTPEKDCPTTSSGLNVRPYFRDLCKKVLNRWNPSQIKTERLELRFLITENGSVKNLSAQNPNNSNSNRKFVPDFMKEVAPFRPIQPGGPKVIEIELFLHSAFPELKSPVLPADRVLKEKLPVRTLGVGKPKLKQSYEQIKQTIRGTTTYLECIQNKLKTPMHDDTLGDTKMILKSKNGKTLKTLQYRELWQCFGYNPETKRYLLGGQFENGVIVTLSGLVYLEETSGKVVQSSYMKRGFEALAATSSIDGRFFAFIGEPKVDWKEGTKLFVLDTTSDQTKKIGEPPAAPPIATILKENPAKEAKNLIASCYDWGALERWYTKLPESIFGFSDEHVLRVSYGKDTPYKRSKKREVKTWNLDELVRVP